MINFFKYYFTYLQLAICICFIWFMEVYHNPIFLFIGYAQIFILPNPESYEEIEKRVGKL